MQYAIEEFRELECSFYAAHKPLFLPAFGSIQI